MIYRSDNLHNNDIYQVLVIFFAILTRFILSNKNDVIEKKKIRRGFNSPETKKKTKIIMMMKAVVGNGRWKIRGDRWGMK